MVVVICFENREMTCERNELLGRRLYYTAGRGGGRAVCGYGLVSADGGCWTQCNWRVLTYGRARSCTANDWWALHSQDANWQSGLLGSCGGVGGEGGISDMVERRSLEEGSASNGLAGGGGA